MTTHRHFSNVDHVLVDSWISLGRNLSANNSVLGICFCCHWEGRVFKLRQRSWSFAFLRYNWIDRRIYYGLFHVVQGLFLNVLSLKHCQYWNIVLHHIDLNWEHFFLETCLCLQVHFFHVQCQRTRQILHFVQVHFLLTFYFCTYITLELLLTK